MDDDVKTLLQQMNEGIQALVANMQPQPEQNPAPQDVTPPAGNESHVSEQLEELTQMVSSLATGTTQPEAPKDDDEPKDDEAGFTNEHRQEDIDLLTDLIEL